MESLAVAHDSAYWSTHQQRLEYRHRKALDWCDEGPVLDVGCGDGLMLSLLKDTGIEAIGVDHAPVARSACHTKGLQVVAEMPQGKFAYALLLDVLEHLHDPEAMLKTVPSDQLIISVPNFASLPARIQTLCGLVPENNRPRQGHIYWFTLDVLTKMLGRNGYEILHMECNTQRGLGLLGKLWPSLFGLSFLIEAKKTV